MSWYSVEPLLSLSARFTFSDVVVILGWSYLRRVDSRITFFSGVHVRSLVRPRGVILEFIRPDWIYLMPYCDLFSSFSYGDDHSLTDMLQFPLLGREVLYLLHWSLFLCCSSRWASSRARCSGFDRPTSQDYSVDCYVKIVVCLLLDYSLRLSDYPFRMMKDSSSRVLWVRGVRLVTTLWQTLWFRRAGHETTFTIDLIIPTRWQNIFRDLWSHFQTLPVD